jgi:hypothetical protein
MSGPELECQISDDVHSHIMGHLLKLQVKVKEYFPPEAEDFHWLSNPFRGSFLGRKAAGA